MKSHLLLIISIMGFISVDAQRLEKSKFGIQVGLDSRNFSVTEPSKGTFSLEGKNSFRAGTNWDICMGEHMLLETGLFYSQLKGEIKYSEKSYSLIPATILLQNFNILKKKDLIQIYWNFHY